MKSVRVFLALIVLTLSSCNEHSISENTIQLNKKTDCNIADLIIPQIDSSAGNVVCIDQPVAITFFNLNKLLAAYDGRCQDSLPERLRGNARQEIYKVYDIAGIYHAIIRPRLDSMSIQIIDSMHTNGFISFHVKGQGYRIDKCVYKETDGVLLYNGKDEPIFWTEGVNCAPNYILASYYKHDL